MLNKKDITIRSEFSEYSGEISAAARHNPTGIVVTSHHKDGAKLQRELLDLLENTLKEKGWCPYCNSLGFSVSVLGYGRCTFCDGTIGGNPPEMES